MGYNYTEREFFFLMLGHYIGIYLLLTDEADQSNGEYSYYQKYVIRGYVENCLVKEIAQIKYKHCCNNPQNG